MVQVKPHSYVPSADSTVPLRAISFFKTKRLPNIAQTKEYVQVSLRYQRVEGFSLC
jgi:hypothetical protein